MRIAILAVLALILSLSAKAEERIALIIANSDYDTSGWDLANPKNDARLIADALSGVGFDVHTVLDGSRSDMEAAFQAHGDRLARAGPGATGFFYFAGHGVQSEGLNYLMPVDARAYTEADVWAQAPRLENLFRHLRRAKNQRNFVVLDACRNNPLLSSSRDLSGGLASMMEASGTLIAYATAPGSVAEDGIGNSPYSVVLAKLLPEPGQSVETLFRRVRTRVEEVTDYRQRPWMESGLSGEADFCFAGCDRQSLLASDEATALGQALQSDSYSALSEFLRRFPRSESRGLVQDRLDRLTGVAELAAGSSRRSASGDVVVPFKPRNAQVDGMDVQNFGVLSASGFQPLFAPETGAALVPGLALKKSDVVDVVWMSTDRTWVKVEKGGLSGYVPAWAIKIDTFD